MPVDHTPPLDLIDADRVYRFGIDPDSNVVLTGGWGVPERGFVWSEGKAALLTLPGLRGEIVFSISLWGYVPNGASPQDVLIFIDGVLKGYFEIHEKTMLEVSHRVTGLEEDCQLLFYIPSARSPLQAEGVPDKRRLGVALAAVKVSCQIA